MNDKHSIESNKAAVDSGITRRDLLLGAGALGGLAIADGAWAEEMKHDRSNACRAVAGSAGGHQRLSR